MVFVYYSVWNSGPTKRMMPYWQYISTYVEHNYPVYKPCAYHSEALGSRRYGRSFSLTAGRKICAKVCKAYFGGSKVGFCIPRKGCRCLSMGRHFFQTYKYDSSFDVANMPIRVTLPKNKT